MHKTKFEKKLIHKFLQEGYFKKYLNLLNICVLGLVIHIVDIIKKKEVISVIDCYDLMILFLLGVVINMVKKKL